MPNSNRRSNDVLERVMFYLTLHSIYYEEDEIKKKVSDPNYEMGSITGGFWEEVGKLQADFLVSEFNINGCCKIIDIGCGDLRGGVKIMDLVLPGHYYGIDMNECLIDKGIEYAIRHGLEDKINRKNFSVNKTFDFKSGFNFTLGDEYKCEYAVAFSLFTHLPIEMFSKCIRSVCPAMYTGGRFIFTFYENKHNVSGPVTQVGEKETVTTFPDRAPYHYTRNQIASCLMTPPWYPRYIGDWGHPGNEKIMILRWWPHGPE